MKLAIVNGLIDMGTTGNLFAVESGFESAIIISLLTDRRADPDDVIPDDTGTSGIVPPDRRGWCGDAFPDVEGDRIGSRLWLLRREKVTEETRRRAIFYATEALQWMIDDGHAPSVKIDAEWSQQGGLPGRLDLLITPTFSDGSSATYTISVPVGV